MYFLYFNKKPWNKMNSDDIYKYLEEHKKFKFEEDIEKEEKEEIIEIIEIIK